jgi:hypothetical protein
MSSRSNKCGRKDWKKPESGGKPKKIETKAPPGGKHTPGAKAKMKEDE